MDSLRIPFHRVSPIASLFVRYYDVDNEKIEKRVVTSDKQIVDLFHIIQEYMRTTCEFNNT